jgi:hypothetical protein
MFPILKKKISNGFLVAIDSAGMVFSLSGASVVAVLGKLMLAVVLGALALGFFLRLSGRRAPARSFAPPTPRWYYVAAAFLSVLEVTLLTEATDLPVRFYQPGFELQHWILVAAALGVAFIVQVQLIRSIFRSRRIES